MNPFLGEMKMFGGNFAPRGWAYCDGQLLSINANQALFSLLGTTYGGDGRTTFALPDLRGRVGMHAGHGPGLSDRRLGARLGTEYNILNTIQLPSHNHTGAGTVKVAAIPGDQRIPTNRNLAGSSSDFQYSDTAPNASMAANNVEVTVGNTGGSQPVYNIQPSEVIHYIIALQGVFPSRS
jgi:microcystin-dependent protein